MHFLYILIQLHSKNFLFFLFFTLLQLAPLFSPFAHLIPALSHPRSGHPLCLCPWVMSIYPLANPFTFFHPVHLALLPFDSYQSVPCIYASVYILFIYFVHQIPHSSEIKTPVQKNICTPLFRAGLFKIAKISKQPKCPSVDQKIQKLWQIQECPTCSPWAACSPGWLWMQPNTKS